MVRAMALFLSVRSLILCQKSESGSTCNTTITLNYHPNITHLIDIVSTTYFSISLAYSLAHFLTLYFVLSFTFLSVARSLAYFLCPFLSLHAFSSLFYRVSLQPFFSQFVWIRSTYADSLCGGFILIICLFICNWIIPTKIFRFIAHRQFSSCSSYSDRLPYNGQPTLSSQQQPNWITA